MVMKFAISGKAKSGKDTLAELLINNLRLKYSLESIRQFAFANPIKHIIMKMFPLTSSEVLWGSSEYRAELIPGLTLSYRQLLINIGKFGRDIDPDIWLNATLNNIKNWLDVVKSEQQAVIISDVRFRNEYLRLRQNNYYLIKVIRPYSNYTPEQLNLSKDYSETNLDHVPDSEFNLVIVNDGSLKELQDKVITIPIS